MSEAVFRIGDVFERLAEIPDGTIDLIVTSPPFLALRSYLPADHPDKAKEIGSEATPAAFLSTLLALTAEWRRVLTPHGSLAVELGDTYSGAGGYGSPDSPNPAYGAARFDERWTGRTARRFKRKDDGWPLDKSLCLLPTLYPASLAYGRNLLTGEACEPWRVRNLIVWHRPNPPVGALGDKVRPSTSYITVACTARNRWFDLDAERTTVSDNTHGGGKWHKPRSPGDERIHDVHLLSNPAGAPPLDCWHDNPDDDVWTIPTQPYTGAHYATFPVKLPRKLINLMCPRQVCTTCGEPRRRVVDATPHADAQTQLAAHIEERRLAVGMSVNELADRFPSGSGGRTGCVWNWEHAANVPTPKQWPVLKSLLDLDNSFDPYIYGDRKWTESTVKYVSNGKILTDNEKDSTGYRRGGFGSIEGGRAVAASRVTPDTWSTCGHDNYRRGVVLDPFAGSGTTLVAASELGRDSIGIDLDHRNLDFARQRCGMFLVEDDEVPV